MSESS
jgi:hypothetical protein